MDHQPQTAATELLNRVFPWEERAGVPLIDPGEVEAEAAGS